MTDDPAIEQHAIRLAFPGLAAGEQEVAHLLCSVHSNRTQQARNVDNRAVVAKSRFRNRKLAVCTKQYEEIGQLPVPIQKLLARELDVVEERIAKRKGIPSLHENLRCHCKFHRQYLLPCRHIFHLDTEIKVLTSIRWETYIYRNVCGVWYGGV